MRHQSPYVLFGLVVCLLLAGCGQTTSSNQGPNVSGMVEVSVDSAAYHGSDPISVAIANQSKNAVYAPDHQTNCSIAQLQMRSGDQWQPMGKCALMTPTRMHLISPGTSQVVSITPPKDGWPTGTYRVALTYSQTQQPAGKMSAAYSDVFQMNA